MSEWSLILEQRVEPFQAALFREYSAMLAIALAILAATLPLAEWLSRRVSRSLRLLGMATGDIPKQDRLGSANALASQQHPRDRASDRELQRCYRGPRRTSSVRSDGSTTNSCMPLKKSRPFRESCRSAPTARASSTMPEPGNRWKPTFRAIPERSSVMGCVPSAWRNTILITLTQCMTRRNRFWAELGHASALWRFEMGTLFTSPGEVAELAAAPDIFAQKGQRDPVHLLRVPSLDQNYVAFRQE